MKKLEIVQLPPQYMFPGRKKPVDLSKVNRVKVPTPRWPEEFVEQILIFDARMLDRATQLELLRLLPQLMHVRRSWKAHYLENGCLTCRTGHKPDPTYKIAANLRREGMPWEKVFEILTLDHELSEHERKLIRGGVCNREKALAKRRNGLPKKPLARSSAQYGGGGFCDACQQRILHRMLARYREAMRGIDAEVAIAREALEGKYGAAQRLFNSDEG